MSNLPDRDAPMSLACSSFGLRMKTFLTLIRHDEPSGRYAIQPGAKWIASLHFRQDGFAH
jgi:hypothetical protein